MVGKKSGKALLREEGLERTDNNMELTTWPMINMINQKNYYTEYLKRDDQMLSLRLLQDERRNRLTTNAKNKDRALAQAKPHEDVYIDMDDEVGMDEGEGGVDQAALGSKVIVIHPGSQNLRIGLASDALPKTVPMVIARKWKCNESEENEGEPCPKRRKLDDDPASYEPEKVFGQDFATQYTQICSDLKIRMRANKRRVLPNSKELVVNYNTRTPPETISEHNDPLRVEWTEIPKDPALAPDFVTGKEALRIPDNSNPRYKLFWPLQHGWYNENEYDKRSYLFNDISTIIEEAIKSQLNLRTKREWAQYGCVVVIPDLYERQYVTQILEIMIRDLGFGRVSFIQESLAASYGSSYSSLCIVDVGAQKSSVCCVEEGMCIEDSRVNIKFGGADITKTFIKMMLFDHFPYADINLKRRYDFVLAEELKMKYCTLNEGDISVQLAEFHLRAPKQETRKYTFKTYDEVLLAPQGLFEPSIFDHSEKLRGRRKLIGPSEDLYDGSPNDPVSAAQSDIVQRISPSVSTNGIEPATNGTANGTSLFSTPARQGPAPFNRVINDNIPSSALGSPAPEGDGTPAVEGENGISGTMLAASVRDDILPVIGLDLAIITSIEHGGRNDDKKARDIAGNIMVIGGGAQVQGFHAFLEERLKYLRPAWADKLIIGTPPRELDPQGVAWKGGSIFGKLRSTSDVWIGRLEYDRLGSRTLAYKCMWAW